MKDALCPKDTDRKKTMKIIGQDMHILNRKLFRALQQRDARTLAAMAAEQARAGAHALDLNLGASSGDGKLLGWAMTSLHNAVDLPLFVASAALATPEVLKMHRGRTTVNSVTADPATLSTDMTAARDLGVCLVVLLVRPGLTPFTAEQRLQLAMDVLETAARTGFPQQDLYLDPLFHLRPDPMTWQLSRGVPDIDSVLETIEMVPQLSSDKVQTLVALSSASQFLPRAERSGLHQRLLPLLAAAGLDAVILNCHDSRLMEIARNPAASLEPAMESMLPEAELNPAVLPW